MDISNPFKARLLDKAASPPLGTWLMAAAPATAEALGCAGLDFLVVDMEHVPIEMSDLAGILRAIGCTPAQAVVRLAWNDQVLVKRALDAGAQTIMLPFVQNAEEARAAAAFAHYPPEGVRGVAAIHRGSRFGQAKGYFAESNRQVCTIVQLETPQALAKLAEIAAVPGIDALFVGPGDLAAAMGHIGDIGHADVQAALAQAARECAALGKPVGIVGPNPEMVARFLDYGYSFAAVSSDIALMTGRATEWLGQLRGKVPAAPSTAAY
jgi:2-dehydro-3-deoxyglucarate aldolase/4-hydroxy-2-oxoheptanedioate aldolase